VPNNRLFGTIIGLFSGKLKIRIGNRGIGFFNRHISMKREYSTTAPTATPYTQNVQLLPKKTAHNQSIFYLISPLQGTDVKQKNNEKDK
jgi:hypothetical protein